VLDFLELIGYIQLLALVNYEVPFSFLRSFLFGTSVYTKINTPILPEVDAR